MVNNSTDPRKPSKIPMILSAFFFPGAGQFFQRRWIPAVLFSVSFITCFIIFIISEFKIISNYIEVGLDFNHYQATDLPKGRAVISFVVATGIYIAGLIDTFWGYIRACSKDTHSKMEKGA